MSGKGIDCMAQTMASGAEGAFSNRIPDVSAITASSPAYQAYQILHVAFVVAPLVAGLDKFFHLLTNWDMYLAPTIANLTGGGHTFMLLVGAIEIVAALLVAFKPRIGAYVV